MITELDHPCRQTCNGWQQGRERGQFEEKKKNENLLRKVYTLWEKHEKTKFRSDGSHFQVDKEIRDLMGEIKTLIEINGGGDEC